MKRSSADVVSQLIEAGVGDYLEPGSVKMGETTVSGIARPGLALALRCHPQFQEGVWDLLHDVGPNQTEFRSYRGAFEKGTSLQIVLSEETGAFEADVDVYNTQDVVNIVGHLVLEVVPNTVRGWFRRLRSRKLEPGESRGKENQAEVEGQ